MVALADVIEGLRATLQGGGLTAYDHVPGTANFPAAVIIPPLIPEYSDDFDEGSYVATFEVAVLVGSAIAENQRALIPLLDPRSPTSIYQKVMSSSAGRSLGGLNVDAWVPGAPRRLTFDEVAAYKAWGQMVLVMVSIS